jgi:hypothetical protein
MREQFVEPGSRQGTMTTGSYFKLAAQEIVVVILFFQWRQLRKE